MFGDIKISDAFTLYRDNYIVMKNQSPKTEEAYRNAGKLLIKLFGDVAISSLKFEDVREWRLFLSTWQKPDTVRGNIICIRNVLKYLRLSGFQVLDYELIPVQKRGKNKIDFLTREEVADFIEVLGAPARGYSMMNRYRNVAIGWVLASTGLRNSELCALNVDSIKDRTFTVVGKSKNPRIGFINDKAENALRTYLSLRADSNKALFVSPQTGKRITSGTLRRIFENACRRSDFENVHPHTMRHSYATDLFDKEVDSIYVSDLLGHTSLDTTRMYIHYSNPKLKRIYDAAQI